MDDGTVNIRVKDGAHIIKVVMLVFEVLAGPRFCSASCREVGRYGPVLKTNARDGGIVQKSELFCLEGDRLRCWDIGFPKMPIAVIDHAQIVT